MSVEQPAKNPYLPPRWVIRAVWSLDRGIYRVFKGRAGLPRPRDTRSGKLRLTTTGRRSGQPRSVIVAYFADGPRLVTLAMNGWDEAEPAWWLNLLADPDATVDLGGEQRPVRARAATGDERARLWDRWREIDKHLDAYAARRPSETAVVVLEPRSAPA
ncbi:nitroreductase/quinone reductase family protein [Pseudonocardia lacus]|uniref:nitroreductase/quinone reductase family protein n=1 Tax=Pseudonocardia lacus TaxID=2835865 RepID=UPI001BDCE93C|nr:nitroreductase/quinone reductase family protein [Pseudonocardia lacus]